MFNIFKCCCQKSSTEANSNPQPVTTGHRNVASELNYLSVTPGRANLNVNLHLQFTAVPSMTPTHATKINKVLDTPQVTSPKAAKILNVELQEEIPATDQGDTPRDRGMQHSKRLNQTYVYTYAPVSTEVSPKTTSSLPLG